MADIVERLRRENDIKLSFGNDLSGLLLDAANEIDRLRDMCINREEFIAQQNLWKEFSKYLSEPHAPPVGGQP